MKARFVTKAALSALHLRLRVPFPVWLSKLLLRLLIRLKPPLLKRFLL